MPVNDAKYIKEVWAENLEEEMAHLRDLVEEYPYLAMVRYEQTEGFVCACSSKHLIQ